MAKDFFDEEYEKQVQSTQKSEANVDSWYNRPAPEQAKSNHKPLYITLICVALILCFAFGWLACYLIDSATTSEEEKILATVIDYLRNNYYEDISEEEWTTAVESSGTALMQYAGDRFSQLMSPQTYYEFTHPTSSVSSASGDGYFGVSFYVEQGIGLYVSSVTANSNAYGKVFEGDIVLQLTDMVGKDGSIPTVSGKQFAQINLSEWASTTIEAVLDATKSATFHILRFENGPDGYHYAIKEIPLERGQIAVVNDRYVYEFVEFYFGDDCTNISTMPMGNAAISTYQERHLDQLPPKTGYVRITQFMDYDKVDGNGNITTITASDEFKQVMDLFKQQHLTRLVLDLKGNPGGNVQYVSEIASMLVTDVKLTNAQKNAVTNNKGELLMTYLEIPKPVKVTQSQYELSSYFTYFGAPSNVCDIVVWTDGGSASGSEMLTGVLLDYGTAVHMGTTSYGKGIAQTWEELPFTGTFTLNGKTVECPWAIYYTCAKYYSPLGTNIHGKGYTPQDGADGYVYDGRGSYSQLWDAVHHYWANIL